MLSTRRFSRLAALTLAPLLALAAVAPTADADATDGKLTVVVQLDVNGNGNYDPEIDQPQPGILIVVTDPTGLSVSGRTDAEGRYEIEGRPEIGGGRYFVVAEIPADRPDLTPVAGSPTFAPMSTTVDVASEDKAVRMGVAIKVPEPESAPAPAPEPTADVEPPATDVAPSEASEQARFAVGDLVFQDLNRSGVRDRGEPAESRVSVQLLDADGDILRSTQTNANGYYLFDNLRAGRYLIRFAGLRDTIRFAPSTVGADRSVDSDPDYSGMTPPFTLGVGESNVRAAVPADGVEAGYINTTMDAGVAPVRYAVVDRVWLDVNGDGVQQTAEPPAAATVALLGPTDAVIATAQTDAQGVYAFTDLTAGTYQLRFEGLPANRSFTARAVGSDRSVDSDADPATGRTAAFKLESGAAGLVDAADAGVPGVDFVNRGLAAGLVGSYEVGDTVWRDANGNGVLEPGEPGVSGVRVELLNADGRVLVTKTTTSRGRYTFSRLPAGSYRVRFSGLPTGQRFTAPLIGDDRGVDSDAGPSDPAPDGALRGESAVVVIGDDHPTDTTIDAGLTPAAGYTAPPSAAAGSGAAPSDSELAETGGVDAGIPLGGLLLLIGGGGCLIIERRQRRGPGRRG